MNAQMKKGVIEMCILYYISKKDLYGYDVMRLMSSYFPDVETGTFYAILRRLHKENALSCYEGKISDGPKRKYYKITDKGLLLLNELRKDWENMLKSVDDIFKTEDF